MSYDAVTKVSGSHGDNSRPYKLGIALSGGGARGFAHVGAL